VLLNTGGWGGYASVAGPRCLYRGRQEKQYGSWLRVSSPIRKMITKSVYHGGGTKTSMVETKEAKAGPVHDVQERD